MNPNSTVEKAGTVSIRVQVIDVESSTLELIVPTYTPAKDITQRIARDANLGGFWPDGTRRTYRLRARGRMLEPDERLEMFNIVQHELLHLLPQPPEPVVVIERPLDTRGLRAPVGFDVVSIVQGFMFLMLFDFAWCLALLESGSVLVGIFPAVALGLAASNFSRTFWGGTGPIWREPLTALGLLWALSFCALIPVVILTTWTTALTFQVGFGFVGGLLGIVSGWIVNRGGVEPLPREETAVGAQVMSESTRATSAVAVNCGICGAPVAQNVSRPCPRGCDKSFHSGCLGATSISAEADSCGLCGVHN